MISPDFLYKVYLRMAAHIFPRNSEDILPRILFRYSYKEVSDSSIFYMENSSRIFQGFLQKISRKDFQKFLLELLHTFFQYLFRNSSKDFSSSSSKHFCRQSAKDSSGTSLKGTFLVFFRKMFRGLFQEFL